MQSIFTNGVVIGKIQNKFLKHHHQTYFTVMHEQDRAPLTQGRMGLLMWIQAADRKYLVSEFAVQRKLDSSGYLATPSCESYDGH